MSLKNCIEQINPATAYRMLHTWIALKLHLQIARHNSELILQIRLQLQCNDPPETNRVELTAYDKKTVT